MAGPRSPTELFLAFNRLALQGFGGVLAVAQRELVERLGWLSREQFVEMLSLAQVLPGPNIINLSIMAGDRWFGWRGVLAALGGMLCVPALLVLAASAGYAHFAQHPVVDSMLRSMGAVAAGLVTATALKLAGSLQRNPLGRPLCAALALAAFLMVGVLRWPLVAVVFGLGSLGIALAVWRLRRSETSR
ncbi:chromate transporter [Piscinibacter sakaiensis]|uniref:Chromate transporter n=1 Tax=Piscinibacter sakaiensis TaxID=1547922 RepID=A0A0K8P374_PISS1|nr:chromate transporter [Piscinibacter sakaiensis]